MRLQLQLSDEQRDRLRALTRQGDLPPQVRERAEVLLLADRGWTAVALGQHFGRSERSIRRWIDAWESKGEAGLFPAKPGPVPNLQRRARIEEALRERLAQPRCWTTPQLAAALAEEGLHLAPRTVHRYLRRLGARYKRVHHHVRHRRDEVAVARVQRALEDRKNAR